jgi:hypothetical protein
MSSFLDDEEEEEEIPLVSAQTHRVEPIQSQLPQPYQPPVNNEANMEGLKQRGTIESNQQRNLNAQERHITISVDPNEANRNWRRRWGGRTEQQKENKRFKRMRKGVAGREHRREKREMRELNGPELNKWLDIQRAKDDKRMVREGTFPSKRKALEAIKDKKGELKGLTWDVIRRAQLKAVGIVEPPSTTPTPPPLRQQSKEERKEEQERVKRSGNYARRGGGIPRNFLDRNE